MSEKRIGLYGGTFSPPHMGHVRAAEAFLSRFRLDMLYIMPAYVPPHKAISNGDIPAHRLNMARIAFRSLTDGGHAVVSELEISRQGKSYTADTLAELYGLCGIKGRHGIYMLTGDDMFTTLDTWRRPEEIFDRAHIVYVSRGGSEELCLLKRAEYEARFGAVVDRLDIEPLPVSATELRRAIAEGRDTAGLLLPEVLEYIEKEGLYREG